MKNKTKLIATLMAMCLVITFGVIGILAVKTLNMSVGGNITFSAEGLDFSISNGTFETTAGAEYPGVNTDTTKLKGFAMNTNTKESDVATQKASWTGLNLTMSSLGDVVLVFTVTNNMTEKLVTTIEVTTLGTNTNNNMEIEVVGGTVSKGTPKEMSITFHIKDTNINAGLTGFAVAVSFAKEGQAGGGNVPGSTPNNPIDSTELPKLKFTTISSTEVSITNNGATGAVVIPAYVKVGTTTYTVTKIVENAFIHCYDVTSVEIPNTVTSIGNWAFMGTSIQSVVLPDSIKTIGMQAFYNTGLTTIKIPASVESTGGGAYYGCRITEVYLDCPIENANDGNYLFNNTEYVYIHKSVTVTNSAFTKVGEVGDYYKYTETLYNNMNIGGSN